MIEFDTNKIEKIAHVLKTIAHPVKLKILLRLAENPSDVSSLCKAIGMDCQISMMSHHLTKMKDNGIVFSEKVGKQVYYSLVDKTILNLFKCMEQCSAVQHN